MRSCALITAAGKGRRMGGQVKKEFITLDKERVLEKTLRAFIQTKNFHKIVITLPKEKINECSSFPLINQYQDTIILCPGAESRQASVYAGLRVLKEYQPDYVLIHDGARPFLSSSLIKAVLAGACQSGACIPVRPIAEALKSLNKNGHIVNHLDRENIVCAQTPQGFDFKLIFQAHQLALKHDRNFPDDAEVYSLLGKSITTVRGEKANIKITYPEDLP